MNQLDTSVKTVWSLSLLGKMLFITAILFVVEVILKPDIDTGISRGYLSLSLLLFTVLVSLFWPILKYKFWRFDVRDTELYIERGVVTRIKTTAPYSRIQHLDVQQNVLERMLNLGKLVVYTAGTRGADLVIPGLPIMYAEALRDKVKNFSPEDAV